MLRRAALLIMIAVMAAVVLAGWHWRGGPHASQHAGWAWGPGEDGAQVYVED